MNINRDTYIQTMGLQWEIWRQMCLFFFIKTSIHCPLTKPPPLN